MDDFVKTSAHIVKKAVPAVMKNTSSKIVNEEAVQKITSILSDNATQTLKKDFKGIAKADQDGKPFVIFVHELDLLTTNLFY